MKLHIGPDIEGVIAFTLNLEGAELHVSPSKAHMLWSQGMTRNSTASLGAVDNEEHVEGQMQNLPHARKRSYFDRYSSDAECLNSSPKFQLQWPTCDFMVDSMLSGPTTTESTCEAWND